jgi:inward rectifier potassium channel
MLNFTKKPRQIKAGLLDRELGFGKAGNTTGRMMNPDGSFNVKRERIGTWDNTYHTLVTMPWGQFFALVFVFFTVLNSFFAIVYTMFGMDNLMGTENGSMMHNFKEAFFFSSQTLTTVGYGHIAPKGLLTNVTASLESFLGLLTFALISGLMYGRFSRPRAKINFSDRMLVAPYRTGRGVMFRMINARSSELIETEVQVILAVNQNDEAGNTTRRFYPVPLEISKVSFFSLSWTIVHEINETSPVWGFTEQDMLDSNAEFLVLVKGTDETNQQTVHTKRSYTADEIVWNARFKPVIEQHPSGKVRVKTGQVGDHELLAEAI